MGDWLSGSRLTGDPPTRRERDMHYVYVLLSLKTQRLYTGNTEDLKQRLTEHNSGIGGKYSTRNKPYKLIYYEAFLSKTDAIKQEHFYKSGHGREILKEKLTNSLKEIKGQ